jgi:hypothetical protein
MSTASSERSGSARNLAAKKTAGHDFSQPAALRTELLFKRVSHDVFDRSIDVHISLLRKKLGDDPKNPRYIKTVRSVGYMLVTEGEERANS